MSCENISTNAITENGICSEGCLNEPINVVCGSILIPPSQKIIAQQYDENSNVKNFILPLQDENGISWTSGKSFYIITRQNGIMDKIWIKGDNLIIGDNYITLRWVISDTTTYEEGDLEVQIETYGESYQKFTKIAHFYVHPTINVDQDIMEQYPTILQQIQDEINDIMTNYLFTPDGVTIESVNRVLQIKDKTLAAINSAFLKTSEGFEWVPIVTQAMKGIINGVASLDDTGRIPASQLTENVVIDANYVHTDNNFTNTDLDKLDNIESGAQVNLIETVQVNGSDLPISDKTVNISVPVRTSQMQNDNMVQYTTQDLTEAQKGQARYNIGAGTSSFGGSYRDVTDKPTLNTDNQEPLEINANETINGVINLHSVSKTGDFGDLNNTPDLILYSPQTLDTNEKLQARTNIGAGTSSFSGSYLDLTNQPENATEETYGFMSPEDKVKLDEIESGAEVNDINTISVNNVNQPISNTNVNITVPTQASDINAVPATRTINGYRLSNDINLNSNDVGAISVSDMGVANGVATLDNNGQIPLNQIPDTILGQVEYLGQWSCNTGSVQGTDLRNPAGRAYRKGDFYICESVGNKVPNPDGSIGYIISTYEYQVGDWLIFTTQWEKVDNTDAVASVNGKIGVVELNASDVGAVASNSAITSGTYPKISYDSKGLVTGGQSLSVGDIPDISDTYQTKSNLIDIMDENVTNSQYPGAKVIWDNYAKYTDYATTSKAGVIKINTSGNQGLRIDSSGLAYVTPATTGDIDARTNQNKPITPSNLDYAVHSVGDGVYVHYLSVMPTADSTNADWVVFYTGATEDNYIQYHIYQNVSNTWSDLGFIRNTDYANASTGGVVKTLGSQGLLTSGSGNLYISAASTTDIDSRTSQFKAIVPSTLDYAVNSVKKNLTSLTIISGNATIESGKIYSLSASENVNFVLPTITDSYYNVIEIIMTTTAQVSVTWGTDVFFNEDIPDVGIGTYDIIYEYNGTDWVVGAISQGSIV